MKSWFNKNYSTTIIVARIVADFLTIDLSIFCGFFLYHLIGWGVGDVRISLYVKLSLVAGLGFTVLFWVAGLYGARRKNSLHVEEIAEVYKAIVLGALFLFALSFFLPREYLYSRLVGAYSVIFILVFVPLEKMVFRELIGHFRKRGFGREEVLIYGAGDTGRQMAKRIIQRPQLGYWAVGFIDDHEGEINIEILKNPQVFTLPILGTLNNLGEVIRNNNVKKLLIAVPEDPPEKKRMIVEKCRDLGVDFGFVPHLLEIMPHQLCIEDIGGIPIIVSDKKKKRLWYQVAKRGFDIIFSLVALILLSPLFFIISRLIKLDSKGPAIFSHKRVGKDGKEFTMYKFRTMYIDANPNDYCPKESEDPRVTKFGRWLRRTSLDEVPQFINVLKGEMSIVGPRPEMPFIVKGYNELQKERVKVKPGITGLWQISGDRASEIHDNIEYDLYYIQNQSFSLDMAITFSTIIFAVRGIGAF